ncbi:methyltransferase domain-containing protein [Micromonospora sp. ATCC 39149]|uniref:methyltransferase domain-containing protein n=1 Tax=Micromonospora sp. (strain ATCC 39149 / NRRL 15099 / SCC 1413) TaxID=219305 RepID=UPI000A011124|nr:methyltransferase domain-containing protein [Micromonospora sp. ATCC 39149]
MWLPVRRRLDYKQRFVVSLDVRPGHAVADIGCGPGTDLPRFADAVGEDGVVVGVDREPRMLEEARHRLVDRSNVRLSSGDIHDLPIADVSVGRARVDRVLQHVADPAKAVREVRRVLRPGGCSGWQSRTGTRLRSLTWMSTLAGGSPVSSRAGCVIRRSAGARSALSSGRPEPLSRLAGSAG